MKKLKGFTLLELLVVMVIIGLLASIVGPQYFKQIGHSNAKVARAQIEALGQALDQYKLDAGRYPSTEQGLAALVTRPTTGAVPPNWKPYLDKLPADPWGKPYQYLSPGLRGEVDVFSFGSDGQSGGTGVEADIGSWDL